MKQLNFPPCELETRDVQGQAQVLDRIRRKWIHLSPEEWVRQHMVQYLLKEKGVPGGLVAIEKGFQFQGMLRRADIVVHNRKGDPLLMVECKAPAVTLDQAVFDQIARYNLVIHARYLFVTNGLQHYCYKINSEKKQYVFLEELPDFGSMQGD